MAGGMNATLLNGALFGAIAYATYDLTNQATMKVWPVHVTLVDIAWGTFATATAAAVSLWVTTRFTA